MHRGRPAIKKILIVDDRKENLYYLRALLKRRGYEVISAVNGAEALDKARQNPPDLVISDVLMPVMDGFDLCREWKKDARLKSIPFIVFTGIYTDKNDRELALNLGADRFVVKSEESGKLIKVIEETIQQAGHPPHGPAKPSTAAPKKSEPIHLKQYNEALVRKLETTIEKLERTNLELEQNISKRKKAEEKLKASEVRYRRLFEAAQDGILILDAETGMLVDANKFMMDMLGFSLDQFKGKAVWELGFLKDVIANRDKFLELQKQSYIQYSNLPLETADGQSRNVEFISNVYYVEDKKVIQCNIRDITERKKREALRETASEVLRVLNEPVDFKNSIQRVMSILKERTGFDAVGIRLENEEDFPYFTQEGFPRDFLLTENTLAERSTDGGLCRGKDGKVSLECTCGLVISGKTDTSNPLFTLGGSCWTNDSPPMLDIPPEADPRSHPRNECIHQGYASIALIPIRAEDKIVGLIQFNGRRKGMLTLNMVEQLEGIALHIGEALVRKRIEDELINSEKRFHSLFDNMTEGVALHELVFEGGKPVNYRIVDVNDSFLDILEMLREKVIGKLSTEAYGTPTPPYFEEYVRAGVDKKPCFFEAYFAPMDKYFSISAMPWGVNGFATIFMDITGRKTAEQKLGESEHKFRLIVENTRDIIFTINPAGEFLYLSPSTEETLGYKPKELMGRSFHDLIFPEDLPVVLESIKHNIQNEYNPSGTEYRFRHASGEWRWHSTIGNAIHGDNGSFISYTGLARDITERKKAEQALRESEAKFRSYIDSAPDGVFTADNTGRYVDVNKAASQLTGYSKEELLKLSIADILAEESAADGIAHFKQLVETGAAINDIWLKRKDASKICVTIDAVRFSETRFLAFCKDITRNKKAQQTMRESEKKYRELVETLHEGIWLIDDSSITTFVNPHMAQMLGYTVEEMLGKAMFYFTDDKWAAVLKEKLSNRAKGIAEQYEAEYIKKNGERLFALVSGTPVLDEKGGYTGSQASVLDLTLRKKVENEVKFESVMEKGLTNISREITTNVTLDIDYVMKIIANVFSFDKGYICLAKMEDEGANNLRVYGEYYPKNTPAYLKNKQGITENGAMLMYIKRFGYVENPLVVNNVDIDNRHLLDEEIQLLKTLGVKSTMVVPVYHRKPLQKNLVALIGFESYENYKVWRKNEVKFIQTIAEIYAIDYERRYSMNELQKAHNELEERVRERTSELQEANKKLKELDNVKSEFLSLVSHELRTPLTSIKAFTEILLKNPDEAKKNRLEFLEIINSENERLTRLIDDVLDLSKIESGQVEWNMKSLSINEILQVSIDGIREVARKNNITLETRVEKGLPLVTADRDKLIQVLMNLLGNAVKYTSEKGTVTAGAKLKGRFVEVFVSDTGIGIAPEHHQAVFDRFKQISHAQTGKPKGTGLGLAICKEIVDKHKGKIWVESEEGKGSIFYFTIPCELV